MLDCTYGCNRKYNTLQAMETHRRESHPNGKMKCRYGCDRQYKTLAAMLVHKTASHDGPSKLQVQRNHLEASPMMKCRYGCDRLFKDRMAMLAHKFATHDSGTGGEPHARAPQQIRVQSVVACNDCGGKFSSVDALRQHQMTRPNHVRLAKEIGSYGCEACNRTLTSQDALERHFTDDHLLIQLAEGDKQRADLVKKFQQEWRKPLPSRPGRVLSVFKIYNPGWRVLKFEQHKAPLPDKGNVVLRYHGTAILCSLGIGPKSSSSKLCHLEGCNLCSILRSGFKTAKARTGWQRFGKGIYTTATSGKSDDYIRSNSDRRAVLVCRVIAGKVYRTRTNNPTLEKPPPGYDSVSGEVGIDLNYDETVVYSSKAILPAFMVVYSR